MHLQNNVFVKKDPRYPENLSLAESLERRVYLPSSPGEIIAVVSAEGSLIELNVAGAIVLEAIQQGLSLRQIISRVAKLFHASPDEVAEDILCYVHRLALLGIIKEDEGVRK